MSNHIPKIRFKGFTHAWEQRKLGEVAGVFDGTHQTPNYTNSGIMFLSVENINSLKSKKFISEEDFDKEFKIFPEHGDVLMTRIGDIGTASVVQTNEKIAYYVSLALLKPKLIDAYFLVASISSENMQSEIWKRTLHVAFPQKINKNEIANLAIKIPHLNEQSAIGNFFRTLDDTITLHQRKLDSLKTLKRGYLQQIFPQTDENVPRIRFAGFTKPWQERKLGEVVRFINGKAYKQQELLSKGKYRVLRVGNFNTNDRWYYSDLELENNKYANPGDLLYLWATTFGPEIWNEERVIYHYHIWKLMFENDSINKQYLYTWLLTDKEQIKRSTNGTTMVHITKGIIEEREFQFPKDITEQVKIGRFFHNLDEQLVAQQQKLSQLKQLKSAYLQRMFV